MQLEACLILAKSLKRNGALEMRFEAFSQHQQVTESSYNNSLADHYIWSTIKTLLATLPELRTIDRGPRTGVTGAVCLSALDLIEGGPQDAAAVRGLQILVDGLD